MKKICFNGLKKVLSEKEMKNVLGGSDSGGSGNKWCYCGKPLANVWRTCNYSDCSDLGSDCECHEGP